MAVAIKMDELLVSWLGSDTVHENVMQLIDHYGARHSKMTPPGSPKQQPLNSTNDAKDDSSVTRSPRGVIPPFYPRPGTAQYKHRRRRSPLRQQDTWEPLPEGATDLMTWNNPPSTNTPQDGTMPMEDDQQQQPFKVCVRDQVSALLDELGHYTAISPNLSSSTSGALISPGDSWNEPKLYFTCENFVRITKEICRFPSFFNGPLFQRLIQLYHQAHPPKDATQPPPSPVVTLDMLEWYWKTEMEPYDAAERFFRLIKQPDSDSIVREDFLPYIQELLNDHPGLEFLSNHSEFQEKYAATVVCRIFYSVNKCHSGRITLRQIRRSDLLEAFSLVDEEEDINKVTRYFSYEHFYVLYCRFWELDHDRDYRITREDLLKYGDHSLSHMIVDRIFDAAPRPFGEASLAATAGPSVSSRDYLSYEDFIYFMLSEEDKANEVSVRYWFTCVDVDGDGRLNNMEMRSFYAVQLHRMQCMGHEIVPFEDMLCQMMDMIKPKNPDFLVAEDFLQPECAQVSGALFDALFNLNKYLLFEQRDPFVERQKREDEFETDWDRFACIDYNRLAMEEEAREEEAMEIDWVTVDDEDDHDEFHPAGGNGGGHSGGSSLRGGGILGATGYGGASEAPF